MIDSATQRYIDDNLYELFKDLKGIRMALESIAEGLNNPKVVYNPTTGHYVSLSEYEPLLGQHMPHSEGDPDGR